MSSKTGNSTDVPLRKEGYTQVKGLIESIENDRNSDAFREPVDWEGKFCFTNRDASILENWFQHAHLRC